MHLDGLIVWKERYLNLSVNQYILIAEEDGILLGFCCAYVNEIRSRSGLDTLYFWVLDSTDVAINFYDK